MKRLHTRFIILFSFSQSATYRGDGREKEGVVAWVCFVALHSTRQRPRWLCVCVCDDVKSKEKKRQVKSFAGVSSSDRWHLGWADVWLGSADEDRRSRVPFQSPGWTFSAEALRS